MPPPENADCATQAVLEDLVNSRLTSADRSRLVPHLGECARCSTAVAQLLTRGDSISALSGEPPAHAPKLGEHLGRYLVVERLGAGGMGTVYRAFDPVLARSVAIKLLHSPQTEVDAALVNEARALAQVSHPNVVHVHEIATDGATTFLVMELVAGETLAQWLATPRSWRAVLSKFIDAARGLEAAHAAGLVHGDFKPANVLLGVEGVVKVADFGLGRATVVDEAQMATGIRGTPAYMSPEVFDGAPADALSDQFSFCVALHEALFGTRPFRGVTMTHLRDVTRAGAPEPITDTRGVPRWLQQAVRRGLGPRETRFASMTALRAHLTRDATRAVRLGAIAVLAVMAVGAVAFAGVQHRQQQQLLCSDAARHLRGVWERTDQERLRAAFTASTSSFAARSLTEVERALNQYAEGWVAARTEVCEATNKRGEQSIAVLDARMGCLDQRLLEFHSLVGLLAEADAALIQLAPKAVANLGPVSSCVSGASLDATVNALPEALKQQLASVAALRLAGQFENALTLAKTSDQRVEADPELSKSPGARGETLFERAESERMVDDWAGARADLLEVQLLAEQAGDPLLSIRADTSLGDLLARRFAQGTEGLHWVLLAQAKLKRIGASPELEAQMAASLGSIQAVVGQLQEAEVSLRRAVSLRTASASTSPLMVARPMFELSKLLTAMNRSAESIELCRRAIDLVEKQLGPDHPLSLEGRFMLSAALLNSGDIVGAEKEDRQTLERYEATGAPMSAVQAAGFEGLGVELSYLGRLSEAKLSLERALAGYEATRGPNSESVAGVISNLVSIKGGLGEFSDLVPLVRRAVQIYRAGRPPNVERLAMALGNLSRALFATGQRDEGLSAAKESFTLSRQLPDPEGPGLIWSFMNLGEALLDAGHPGEALPLLEKGFALAHGPGLEAQYLPETEEMLGCALLATRGDAKRANALLTHARAEAVKAGESGVASVKHIDTCRK